VRQAGTLTTIEFKRDRSPRSAVTQLFDYASSLARLDQDEFFDLTDYESLGNSTGVRARGGLGVRHQRLRARVRGGLESPQLMLVAYTITDDVRRMTRWLRDTHDLKINCVEFDYYERDDAEMFVPTVIGVDETRRRSRSGRRRRSRRSTDGSSARYSNASKKNFPASRTGARAATAGSRSRLATRTLSSSGTSKGDPGDKEFHVVMNFQFDDYARNEELLETMQSAIEDRSLDVPGGSITRSTGVAGTRGSMSNARSDG